MDVANDIKREDRGEGSLAGGADNERGKDRDRRGRSRNTRFSDANNDIDRDSNNGRDRDRSRGEKDRQNCRVYISNIPYDFRWQDLKDLFRRVVGSVEYVELFSDENGKPRGCGIVEFKDPDNVDKAMEKMNRFEINGRELVVKEDHGENRDQYGRILRDDRVAGGNSSNVMRRGGDDRGFSRRDRDDDRISSRSGNVGLGMLGFDNNNMSYNTYGLSAGFLESLGINGPLHNKVFVANLDYKVDSKKLKQVFKLAGKVQNVELSVDKEGNSRGFAVVEYDHPVEAVQSISMLDRQMLFDRRMTVRLDRIPDKGEGVKLPEGLGGIGVGLGPNGEPLKDVSRNLPNSQQSQQSSAPQQEQMQLQSMQQQVQSNLAGLVGQVAPVNPVSAAVSSNAGLLGAAGAGIDLNNLSGTNLAALRNVVGGLKNLAGVGGLSNPLLSNLGLNLNQSNDGNQQLTNNYSTGNNYSSGYGNDFSTSQQSSSAVFESMRNQYNTGSDLGRDMGMVGGNDYNSMSSSMYNNTSNSSMVGGGGGGGGSGRKSDTIIIKNIPITCTWQTLRDKFRDIGEVKFAEIRGNDVGVVRFFKEKDAELAIKLMDGSRMDGRTVSVAFF